MTLGELRDLIKDLPDDVLVVVPYFDHSFKEAHAVSETVVQGSGYLSEFWDDQYLQKEEVKIKALVIT
jgi:hypothetical protein